MAKASRLLILASLALLALAGSAQAKQIQQYFYSGESFDAGGAGPAAIALDGLGQKVLVAADGNKDTGLKISKFHPNGAPAPFSGLPGEPGSFSTGVKLNSAPSGVAIAVDESATASAGNFYVSSLVSGAQVAGGTVHGYAADGTPLAGFPISVPGACGVSVAPDGKLWIASADLSTYGEFTNNGELAGRFLAFGHKQGGCHIELDSAANLYVAKGARLAKHDADLGFLADLGPSGTESGQIALAFDRAGDSLFRLSGSGANRRVTQLDPSGEPLTVFGGPDPTHFFYPGLGGNADDLALDPQTHKAFVLNEGAIDIFSRDASVVTVPSTTTGEVESLTGASATLTGTLDPDGIDTTSCRFEWGASVAYGKVAPCTEGNVFAGGSGVNEASAAISGLQKGATYHYRLVSENSNGALAIGRDREFAASDPPILSEVSASHITSEGARIGFEINTNGANSTYRVEIGTDTSYGMSFPVPDAQASATRPDANNEAIEVILAPQPKSVEISAALEPDTLYHYRVVAENPAGITESEDQTFRTFALPSSGADTCPNAQARQQTGAAGLLDCRAYELVSAPDTGGYDVRSDLAGDVTPLPTSPAAEDAAVYSLRSGTIPGIAGNPTNRGADPYVAERGPNGWSTRYVGIPANNPNATGPFASPLLAFDGPLFTFAFGGPEICNPCFEDGTTNVPLRLPDGSLVQGMVGSFGAGSGQEGVVKRHFSEDGSHFLFGSKAQLEPDANESGTDLTIYDRDLKAGITQVVSKDETGQTIANGDGVAALDISADGSRIVIGKLLSTDASGNPYYHLYLHQGTSPNTIDLTPGTTTGALYAGMSADGSAIYFTTKDPLSPSSPSTQDLDSSADLYRVDVDGTSSSLALVTTPNSDECDPVANSAGPRWNVVGSIGDCSVATVAGGGGVSESGAIYFLSPEQLDGAEGTEGAPNLYRAEPGGEPQFVTTLESQLSGQSPLPLQYAFIKSFTVPNNPQSLATDHSAGYLYVASANAGVVRRFDREGNPANFTAGPNAGTNTLTGFTFGTGTMQSSQVAVDNSGGATDGTLYVTNNSAVDPTVKAFSRTGAPLGSLVGTQTPETRFGTNSGTLQYPTGVAVDPNGALYVAGGNSGKVYRYVPSTSPVAEADYDATLNYGDASNVAGGLSADADGALYAHRLSSIGTLAGGLSRYEASQFSAAGTQVGTLIDAASTAAYLDPQSSRLYVDRGSTIAEYLPNGELLGLSGQGKMSESKGIAVLGSPDGATSRVFASIGGNKVVVFDTLPAASNLVDNPLVVHAVHDSDAKRSADFQTSASGNHAVFLSTISLTGFDSHGRQEIFRYATGSGIDCASCNPTGSKPPADLSLSSYGANLTDDGRVFFTSAEPLVLRDSNEKADAYEWNEGTQQLISTGTSESDSALLSVSTDGKNAFFFTRQKLVKSDENGNRIRLYTARENGGFAQAPPIFECAASDECHGPSTEAPRPLTATTTAGTPGQFAEEPKPKCRKGKVRRRGRCVKRNQGKRQQGKGNAKRANAERGSGK